MGRSATILLYLLVGTGIFSLLTVTPPFLTYGGFMHLPQGVTVMALALAAVSALLPVLRDAAPKPAPAGLLFLAVATAFGLALQALWGHAINTGWVDVGLFPNHDAHDFYSDALNLLHSGTFATPRGRPVTSAVVAGLLGSTGLSLKASAAVVTLIAAFGCWLSALAAWRLLGLVPAVLLAALGFDFFHEQIASTSSEPIGYISGAAAFVLLTESARTRRGGLFVLGMAALALTMILRVGPMLLLPALAIWAGFAFRGDRRFGWHMPLAGMVAAILLILANGQVARYLTPDSPGFANAPDSWYATIVLGKAKLGIVDWQSLPREKLWVQIYNDHPEVGPYGQATTAGLKVRIVVEEALRYPHAAALGALLEWNKYLFDTRILEFVEAMWLRGLLMVLLVLGLVDAVRRRRDPIAGFILAANLGIFLSIPFLYGGGARVQAGTVGFTVLLVALGLAAVMRWAGRQPVSEAGRLPLAAAAALLAMLPPATAVLAIGVHAGRLTTATAAPACAEGERAATGRFVPGSSVQVLQPGAAGSGALLRFDSTVYPAVAAEQARWWRTESAAVLTEALKEARRPVTVAHVVDLGTGRPIPMVFDGIEPPLAGVEMQFCLRPHMRPGLFSVRSFGPAGG